MAYEERINDRTITLPAAAALTQFTFVKLNASGQAAVAGAADVDVIGVVQNDPAAAGDEATIALPGCVTKILCSASGTQGGAVTTAVDGEAADAVATNPIWGYYIGNPGADQDVVSMLFTGYQGDEA